MKKSKKNIVPQVADWHADDAAVANTELIELSIAMAIVGNNLKTIAGTMDTMQQVLEWIDKYGLEPVQSVFTQIKKLKDAKPKHNPETDEEDLVIDDWEPEDAAEVSYRKPVKGDNHFIVVDVNHKRLECTIVPAGSEDEDSDSDIVKWSELQPYSGPNKGSRKR